MDGAMPKTVLIVLAAVVALIVIVVLTGMRYLRADDDDDFDDDAPAEHGGSRSRTGQPANDQARLRQRHGDELQDERPRERVGAARAARPASARGSDPRGADAARGSSRGQDRSWREDSAITSRSGRDPQPGRGQRSARSSRRDPDDISQPMAAAGSGRTMPPRGRGDDYDSLPGRRVTAGYDRDPRQSSARRDRPSGYDDGDDLGVRRDRRDRGDGRSASQDRTELLDSRPLASVGDSSAERDERSTTRPNARPDARKTGSQPDSDLLPAVKPRQSKTKRENEGDWPSNEWDELSDVDYWAELASGKPFTADAPADSARSEQRESQSDRDAPTSRNARPDREARRERGSRSDRDPRSERDARADRAGRSDRDSRTERAARADRDVRQDSRIGPEPVTKQMSRPGREPDSGVLPAARHRDLPADRPSAARSADSRPAIADDDPLTSPSFPRIAADDSRSYRRTRSATGEFSYGAATGGTTGELPQVPRVEPVRGIDAASVTRRHSLPAARGSELTEASDSYRPAASAYPSATDRTAASSDQYRALSGSHQVPEVSEVPASYQVPAVHGASGYDATASYSRPAQPGGYQVQEPAYGGSSAYQAAPSYPAGAADGYPANGSPSGGYLPPVAGSTSGFAAETSSGSYHSLPAADPYRSDLGSGGYQPAASYDTTSPYESPGYPSTNGYEPAGYESTSSYGLPTGHGGHVNGSGHRLADYSSAGYRPADYPSYGTSGPASGSHQRPESGYPSGNYGHSVDPAAAGSLPAADAGLGYPVYPAPVSAAQSGYGSADTQLPGYGTAPYQPAGYDPAGYQPPPPEANGYAGADPYAVDPYGQHGYGGSGY
jgi:hypothetical protein